MDCPTYQFRKFATSSNGQQENRRTTKYDKRTFRSLKGILTGHCDIGNFAEKLRISAEAARICSQLQKVSWFLSDRTFEDLSMLDYVPLRKLAGITQSSECFKSNTTNDSWQGSLGHIRQHNWSYG